MSVITNNPVNEFDEDTAPAGYELVDDPGFGLVSLAIGVGKPYILIFGETEGGDEVQVVSRGYLPDDAHAILCEVAEQLGERLEAEAVGAAVL